MELKHYGVKGMKWGQNIMAQEYIPVGKRPNGIPSVATTTRPSVPSNMAIRRNRPINPAFQVAQAQNPKKVKVVGISPEGKKQVVVKKNSLSKKETAKRLNARLKQKETASEKASIKKKSSRKKTSAVKKSSTNSRKETQKGDELDDIALKAIRGDYGNGEDRKKALGEEYAKIQARVNELLKGENASSEKKKTATKKRKSIRKGGKTASKIERRTNREGIEIENNKKPESVKQTSKQEKADTQKENRSLKRRNQMTSDEKQFIKDEEKKYGKYRGTNYASGDWYLNKLAEDKKYRRRQMANARRRAHHNKKWYGQEEK